MSRLNDAAIAAEDGPALPFPPRTLEAWLQLNATEKVADDIGRLAGGVEWSALALAAFVAVCRRCNKNLATDEEARAHTAAGHVVDVGSPTVRGKRCARDGSPCPPSGCYSLLGCKVRDGEFVWAAISDEKSRLTRAAWGGVRLSDPIVAAALEAAGREEIVAKYSKVYRCATCLEAGDLSALFDWGGALFIHLLTCPHFAKSVE